MLRKYAILACFVSGCIFAPPQEKDPVKDGDGIESEICIAEQKATEAAAGVAIGSPDYDGDELAQSFKASYSKTVEFVGLQLKKLSKNLNPNFRVSISVYEANSLQSPSTNFVAQGQVTVGAVSENSSLVRIPLDSPVNLGRGTNYILRVSANYPASNTEAVQWLYHSGTPDNYEYGEAGYETVSPASDLFTNTRWGAQRDFVFAMGCGK